MSSTTPVNLVIALARGVLTAFGWVMVVVGAMLEGKDSPPEHTSPTSGEFDEDGHLVKRGTTDFL